jgi:hypothetical protein
MCSMEKRNYSMTSSKVSHYRSRVLRHGIGPILSVFADRGPLSQTVVASSVGRWVPIPVLCAPKTFPSLLSEESAKLAR